MSTWASAQLSPALDRFSISAGAYRADPKLNASLDTQYGRFESGDLKQRDVTLPRVRADLILFDSQGLSFDYFQYKWAAAGFKDTLLRWKMKPEVVHGNEKAIQPRVQA